MPGLVGIVDTRSPSGPDLVRLDAMVEAVTGDQPYEAVSAASAVCASACVHLGVWRDRVAFVDEERSSGLLLDGWIWNDEVLGRGGPPVDAAEFLYRGLRREGATFLSRVNGAFAYVLWDDGEAEAWLGVDRFGLRSVQYTIDAGRLLFGCEGKAILAASSNRPELTPTRVLTSLAFGPGFFSDETFFRGIRVLPGGCVLHWRHGGVSVRRYWDLQFEDGRPADQECVHELADTLMQSVERRLSTGLTVGLTLSGGLDSRVLAGALGAVAGERAVAFTFGLEQSDETHLAAQVASQAGLPWRLCHLGPRDYIDRARWGVWLTEGLDTFVQSYGLHVYPEIAREVDVCSDGLELEVTLGGQGLPAPEAIGTLTHNDALALALRIDPLFDDAQIAALWGSPEAARVARRPAEDLWAQCPPQPTAADAIIWFTLRFTHSLRYRQAWMRRFVEDCLPSFDRDFIDAVRRVPAADRTERRLQRRVLCAAFPELAQIPYQSTMLPVSVPVEFWDEAAVLEGRGEALALEVWRATDGAVKVPCRRYFSDYDLWLRADPGWLALTDELLLSRDCRLAELGVEMDVVGTLVDEHRRAVKGHRRRLLALMTLELFLRSAYWEGARLPMVQDLWS